MSIYLEQVLILLGVVCAAAAIILCFYLILSKRKSAMYKKIINDDTTEVLSLLEVTEGYKKDDSEIGVDKTQLLTDPVSYTEFLASVNSPTEAMGENVLESRFSHIEEGVLEGKYIIEKELGGGGMSRVFLARHKKLGNKWVIKYIDSKTSYLANEEDILKRLNHINLPKIVDIFHDSTGVYIVETYIEGISLDKVLASGQVISPALALDFTEQFVMVLNYLHNLKPQPIIHCDLKPSNIIITSDNKLVLIDFGISKISGSGDRKPIAATYRYAAPEQLKKKVPDKYMGLVSLRFGDASWMYFQNNVDVRTDIFSMGTIIFEMITGQIPTVNNENILRNYASEDFCKILYKCIQPAPDDRYNNVDEIREDLLKVRTSKVTMLRSLFIRKTAFVAMVAMFALSLSAVASGTYLIQLENGSVITVYPESITVSMKQYAEIYIEKIFEKGNKDVVDANDVVWDVSDDSIVAVSGNKLIGIKSGSTTITGTYKNKKINVKVNVTPKLNDQAEVSLKYDEDGNVSRWCGDATKFESIDGGIDEAAFCIVGSITETTDGCLYVSDSGIIRKYDGERFSSIASDKSYVMADVLKAYNNELYMLSDVWYDLQQNPKYGLFKVEGGNYVSLAEFDAENTNIVDFAVDKDYLYYAMLIPYADSSSLTRYNKSTGQSEVLCELDYAVQGICVNDGIIYVSSYDEDASYAYILQYNVQTGELTDIAGIENMRNFVDSTAIQCFAPSNMQFYNGELYFFDYNVLRKIKFTDNGAESFTVIGIPSAEFNDKPLDEAVPFDEVVLTDMNNGFYIDQSGIYITDKYNGYILKAISAEQN